jgi:hypothetical protein
MTNDEGMKKTRFDFRLGCIDAKTKRMPGLQEKIAQRLYRHSDFVILVIWCFSQKDLIAII